MFDALIHLRVPAATKARWVRESRAAGMRLTDWIVARIDGQKGKTMIQYTIKPMSTSLMLRLKKPRNSRRKI